jgi:hypothetical protein
MKAYERGPVHRRHVNEEEVASAEVVLAERMSLA